MTPVFRVDLYNDTLIEDIDCHSPVYHLRQARPISINTCAIFRVIQSAMQI